MLSVLDIFKVGVGPSSSHTVGPMRIATRFLLRADREGVLDRVAQVRVELNGSLALTGIGHGTDRATILGLAGLAPDTMDAEVADAVMARVAAEKRLQLAHDHGPGPDIAFDPAADIVFGREVVPTVHPNEMRLVLLAADGAELTAQTYYSVGGGFIASADEMAAPVETDAAGEVDVPYVFGSAQELLALCRKTGKGIDDLILANEDSLRPRAETNAALDRIWQVMDGCIDRGLATTGMLPGGLEVNRRAPSLYRKLTGSPLANEREQLFDWLNVYAMAVNEENAAGGQVVTAPTNGAAGIIPSVLKHYCADERVGREDRIRRFLLTAGGIGILYKQRASISGAEMGCQGEVGVACSMAAAGLAAVWGGTPAQVEHAAEIGMEHNLGLTCDPVGGLVQIPCIERNAIGAVKAVNAARLALRASDSHKVSLDSVIETMRQTGEDMSRKYKETSEGGLAVNVVEC